MVGKTRRKQCSGLRLRPHAYLERAQATQQQPRLERPENGAMMAANLLDGDKRRVSDRITAYNLYTDPPLGRCGMTEAEVRASGRKP